MAREAVSAKTLVTGYSSAAVVVVTLAWVAWGPAYALGVLFAGVFCALAVLFGTEGYIADLKAELDRLEDALGDADDELDQYDRMRETVDDLLNVGATVARKKALQRWLDENPRRVSS